MSVNNSFAREVRIRRLYRHGDQRLFVVPLDHSVTDGPIARASPLNELIGQLADNGVDAVVLHKGSLRYIDPRWFASTSLIVHLSASTVHAPDPDAKYLVASVEEALRLGADAVSVHVNLGSRDEMRQIADLAAVSDACDRWNMPLLAMMYPRGPMVSNSRDPELVAHAVTLAADLGADIVKTMYVGSVAEMSDVARGCPIPILVAGGAPDSESAVLSYVEDALCGGSSGVAMGRNVFQAPDPGAMARKISDLIHCTFEAALVRSSQPLAVAGS
ncbi:2-amino-3,7-dideoxy-D-threo-hept-6-ulosonate synthase [Micromonospora pisi]|uniref:2-amino-3,7-dideoxy-D-threo-hept-6-ulosonate synthase n=1 Tax=Micromonospora pisi TaxID=589240 RepID=A0A495JNH2_9ACTN|nr:2-amino-3,7-dideoxy-D-threo-hept-6-ulosonate synthase [Micromonospora pisi]RKR90381.1 2-amino-3,7-dideoxy-D-threo-hept-6-ulosonate synthase [Micromonospora pisi]